MKIKIQRKCKINPMEYCRTRLQVKETPPLWISKGSRVPASPNQ